MTNDIVKRIAKGLDGIKYSDDLPGDIEKLAKDNNIVIVYGESDDLVEFRGAILDEVSGFAAITIKLDGNGIIGNECADDFCPYFEKIWKKAKFSIIPTFNKFWTFETNIPHEFFFTYEGDEAHCQGIVFNLDDLKELKNENLS